MYTHTHTHTHTHTRAHLRQEEQHINDTSRNVGLVMRIARRRVWWEQMHEEATEKTWKDKMVLNWKPAGAELRRSSPSSSPEATKRWGCKAWGQDHESQNAGGSGPPPTLQSAHWTDKEESCSWHPEEMILRKPLQRNSCCPDSASHGWEERPPAHRMERGRNRGAGTVLSSGSHTHTSASWVSGQRDRPWRVHGEFQHKQPKVRGGKKEIPTSEARGEVM